MNVASLNVTLMISIGIVLMLLLVVSFLAITLINLKRKSQLASEMQVLKVQQQNQLIEAAVRSEEIERHRIAETLHDEVGAILSATKLHFQGIKAGSMDDRDKQLYERGKELLDEGIKKVRGISHNLHSNILNEFGLNEAIRHFIKNVVQSTLVQTETALDDQYLSQNPENDISIYRLVQELINNSLKHAHPSFVKIASEYTGNELILTLENDGSGLSQSQFEEFRYRKEGLGLKNIQNRVILLKGSIHFVAGSPNRVLLTIPLNRQYE